MLLILPVNIIGRLAPIFVFPGTIDCPSGDIMCRTGNPWGCKTHSEGGTMLSSLKGCNKKI